MIIAVTGGIGAGKSTVLGFFAEFGARVADADEIAHSCYRRGRPSYDAMVRRWGSGILASDGEICRKAVAGIVFHEQKELDWLNELIHPMVLEELDRLSAVGSGVFFCAVPLLYEFGWERRMDSVVVVWCPADVQLSRLRLRGWSDDEIRRRLSTQLSMDEKLSRGDYGIINDCTLEELAAQCRSVMDAIVGKASEANRSRNGSGTPS